jgi:hypothetical protein
MSRYVYPTSVKVIPRLLVLAFHHTTTFSWPLFTPISGPKAIYHSEPHDLADNELTSTMCVMSSPTVGRVPSKSAITNTTELYSSILT